LRIRNPVSFLPLDPGSGMNNLDHIIETIFRANTFKFFDADPVSGMEKIRIRDVLSRICNTGYRLSSCICVFILFIHFKTLAYTKYIFLLDIFQAPRMGKRGGALVVALLAVLVRAGNALCPASCHCQLQFTVVQCLHAGLEVRKYMLHIFYLISLKNMSIMAVRVH
jgi:hypothetical protein